MKTTIKYFPFSPGIGWKVKHGKYILPEINLEVWNRIIKDKNLVVVAHGGLIESYFSLIYLEMLNYITSSNKILWCGDSTFNDLVKLNGIADIYQVPKEILSQYPVPIFMDAKQNLYLHCLNNYQIVIPYYGGRGYRDKSLLSKQLLRNFFITWDQQYLPKFRKLTFPSKSLLRWSKITKLDLNQPYVCLFQHLNYSQHSVSALSWNEYQIKSLSTMLKQHGIATLVFTKHAGKFYNSSVHCPEITMENIVSLIPKAKAVLSEEVDFLFLAMMFATDKIIMNDIRGKYNLQKNNKFLNIQKSKIFTRKHPTPLDVFNILV